MAMTLRLSEKQDALLTALAESQGISKHEAVCRAIVETADRHVHDTRVRELSETARSRYDELLERLGQRQ